MELTSNAAMDACASGQWHGSPHRARLQTLRRRLHNVRLCRRVTCTNLTDAAYIDEELAHDAYALLRNCPPAFDQLARVPMRSADAYTTTLTESMTAMQRAMAVLYDEWQYHYYYGKVCAFVCVVVVVDECFFV